MLKQYATELRRPHRGHRWIGPIVEAQSMADAHRLLAQSPYKVVGELIVAYRQPDTGEISRFIQMGPGAMVIH